MKCLSGWPPRCAVVAAGLFGMAAQAQEFGGPPPDAPMRGDFELVAGGGISHGPRYLGSDEQRTRALPFIAARWSNGWFAGIGGVGWRYSAGGPFSAGVRLGADFGREEDDANALRGLGDIKRRPEIGAFASWRIVGPVSLGTSFRYGSGNDSKGLLADLSLRGALPLGGGHRLFGGATATWANREWTQGYFGIDAAQAARSGYAPYSPEAGWRDVAFNVGWGWQVMPQLGVQLGVGGRRLVGDAASSPIVRDRDGTSVFGSLSWRF
jgi:MipA family protein